MAYVLGYFAADGCMLINKRGSCFIEFTSKDKDLLVSVRNIMRSNHCISIRPRPEPQKTTYRLQIGSKEIFTDLKSLGFTQAKSKSLKLPDIPSIFLPDFIRGYFDGDGHVSIVERKDRLLPTIQSGFTSGSQEFLKELLAKLKRYAMIQGGKVRYNRAYRLNFSVSDSWKLYNFIYHDAGNLFLARKRVIFEKYYGKKIWTGSSAD